MVDHEKKKKCKQSIKCKYSGYLSWRVGWLTEAVFILATRITVPVEGAEHAREHVRRPMWEGEAERDHRADTGADSTQRGA